MISFRCTDFFPSLKRVILSCLWQASLKTLQTCVSLRVRFTCSALLFKVAASLVNLHEQKLFRSGRGRGTAECEAGEVQLIQ